MSFIPILYQIIDQNGKTQKSQLTRNELVGFNFFILKLKRYTNLIFYAYFRDEA